MEKYICSDCGYQGRPAKIGKLKIIKELLVWLILRIINVFYFLYKTCPKYHVCPKCKRTGMLSLLHTSFSEYYSLYARVYTLSFLVLQRIDIKDKENQKLILVELLNFLKFAGNSIDLVLLHELEPLEQLTKQLLFLSKSDNPEIVSLAIEILLRLNISGNPQKENIVKRIAEQGG
ncbi:MAG: hypothetical protein PHR47_00195 [Candidatus Pacebacteria bacterium]|nr:hypothetical protein [Candidatus Paceibacterota bacterium]